MARHTEQSSSAISRAKPGFQPVMPVLPLRPMKRRPAAGKAQEATLVKNGAEHNTISRLPSGGCGTPDQTLKIQFGEVGQDDEQAMNYSLTSFDQTCPSVDVVLPSSMLALRQLGILVSQKLLPDTSNNDDLTQNTLSRPSSVPLTLKSISDDPPHSRRQTPQTSVVELPAGASIPCCSSLNISFLYQEDHDCASPTSNLCSETPVLVKLPTVSQPLNPAGTSSPESQSHGAGGIASLRPKPT